MLFFTFFKYEHTLRIEVMHLKCVGIIGRLEDFKDQKKWFVNSSYIKVIETLGWSIYPIFSNTCISYALSVCDCLIIPGGYDVQGYYVKEEKRVESTYYDSYMDHFDFMVLDAFVKAKKPVLGICRGIQIINLYFHGSLLTHINDQIHAKDHVHAIYFASGSVLTQLYQTPCIVNSFHHQVVGKLGDDLQSLAYSEEMYVEAIAHKHLPIIGVQWHPELMENDQILPYFFDILCA